MLPRRESTIKSLNYGDLILSLAIEIWVVGVKAREFVIKLIQIRRFPGRRNIRREDIYRKLIEFP